MKKILIVTLLVVVGVFSQGCGNQDYDDDGINEVEEYEDEDDQDGDYEDAEEEDAQEEDAKEQGEEEEDAVTTDEGVRVGSANNGFVTIPADWKDLSVDNGEVLVNQYTTADGAGSITLFATREPVGSAEETAAITVGNLEAQGANVLGTSVSELDGHETHEIMVENAEGLRSFMWFFEAEEGVYSLIAEGTGENFELAMGLIGTTYGVNQ